AALDARAMGSARHPAGTADVARGASAGAELARARGTFGVLALGVLRVWPHRGRCVAPRRSAVRVRAALGAAQTRSLPGAEPVAVTSAADRHWMQAALEEAALAPLHGDVPVGDRK